MKKRILVVEDNPMNLELVSDLLELNHFEVLQARSGEEAIRLVRDKAPDLVLMDLSLPGMDGLETTRTLRQDPSTSRIRIVALTAHAMQGDKEMALRAGCDGYLVKPINTWKFPKQMEEFLSV